MAKVKLYNIESNYNNYYFKCHAGHHHYIRAKVGDKPDEKGVWGFNGNIDRPSFTPSVNETCGRFVPDFKELPIEEQTEDYKEFLIGSSYRCHFTITNGVINYHGDCTHEFVNQNIELLDLPE